MDEDIKQPEWGIKLSKMIPIPQRFILVMMGFFCAVNGYTMRVCLSLAITQLVQKKNKTTTGHKAVCKPPADQEEDTRDEGETDYQDWSEATQGLILASFFIGYMITHLPAGVLSEKYGAKYVLGIGFIVSAIVSLVTPFVIKQWGATGLIIARIVLGLGEGPTYPCLSHLIAQWVPPNERGTVGGIVLGGGQIGTIIANTLGGILMTSYTWRSVFYVFGVGGALWSFFFIILCFSDPASHPYIKPSEREYIASKTGRTGRRKDLPDTPWKPMLLNVPVIAMIIAQVGHDWGLFVMITDLPKYMNDVMSFSVVRNGLYSSLPFGLMWIVAVLWGFVTDLVMTKELMQLGNVRKYNTMISAVGPGVFMVAASYAGCNHSVVVLLFTIGMGLMGPYYQGVKLTPVDISPNYSATVMALQNGIGAITGFIAPYLVGLMTPNSSLMEWRICFWLAFIILTASAVVFLFFGSADIQDFDSPDKMEKNK